MRRHAGGPVSRRFRGRSRFSRCCRISLRGPLFRRVTSVSLRSGFSASRRRSSAVLCFGRSVFALLPFSLRGGFSAPCRRSLCGLCFGRFRFRAAAGFRSAADFLHLTDGPPRFFASAASVSLCCRFRSAVDSPLLADDPSAAFASAGSVFALLPVSLRGPLFRRVASVSLRGGFSAPCRRSLYRSLLCRAGLFSFAEQLRFRFAAVFAPRWILRSLPTVTLRPLLRPVPFSRCCRFRSAALCFAGLLRFRSAADFLHLADGPSAGLCFAGLVWQLLAMDFSLAGPLRFRRVAALPSGVSRNFALQCF